MSIKAVNYSIFLIFPPIMTRKSLNLNLFNKIYLLELTSLLIVARMRAARSKSGESLRRIMRASNSLDGIYRNTNTTCSTSFSIRSCQGRMSVLAIDTQKQRHTIRYMRMETKEWRHKKVHIHENTRMETKKKRHNNNGDTGIERQKRHR